MAKSRKLFKDISISNNVSRNGFDLSRSMKFTAKCGELLPIMHRNVMPGDVFKISLKSFTRTRPVVTAAFTKINEYYDFFFVPYRLLGKQIPHVLAQDKDNPVVALSSSSNSVVSTQLPYTNIDILRTNQRADTAVMKWLKGQGDLGRLNEFGFSRLANSQKLLNYLGYCYLDTEFIKNQLDSDVIRAPFAFNSRVSLLPLACYQKIYYDFYRNTQWEDNVPYNYNFDYMSSASNFILPTSETYWSNPTLFDLRYANYPKDVFYGLLPDAQYGDASVVVSDIDSTVNTIDVIDGVDGSIVAVGTEGAGENWIVGADGSSLPQGAYLQTRMNDFVNGLSSEFSILELRKAKAVQKYREIIGTGRKDYKSIIQKIFNHDVPDTLSDMCIYLGGHMSRISINEVDNTNLVQSNEAIDVEKSAIQRGKGIGSSQSDLIEFKADEYGCIMCIYHAQPEIDYALNAFHFDTTKVSVDDFANPIFDKLGLQEFHGIYLDNTAGNYQPGSTGFLGYSPRYYDYKTGVDMIVGDFRESLRNWVAPIDSNYLLDYNRSVVDDSGSLVLNMNFFKVNPSILNSIFDFGVDSFIDSDQLRVSCDFTINAVRNLDYIGLPF